MLYRVFFKKPLGHAGYYTDVEAINPRDAEHYIKALHKNAIIVSIFGFDEFGNLIKEVQE